MRFSREEIDALVRVLDYYVPDLHAEITRTEEGGLRVRLREREALLLGLRQRLVEARGGASDTAEDELLTL